MRTGATVLLIAALTGPASMAVASPAALPTEHDVQDAMRGLAVKAALINKLGGDAMGITVTVDGDLAILTGQVNQESSRVLAEQVALTVTGIARVANHVSHGAPSVAQKTTEAVQDAALEVKVKSALLGEIGANAFKIDVTAVDGVVSLRGTLDNPDLGRAAVQKAQAVDGVRDVVNLIN